MTTIEDGTLAACMSRHPAASEYGRHHRDYRRPYPRETLRVLDGAEAWDARNLTGQHRPEVRRLIAAGVIQDDRAARVARGQDLFTAMFGMDPRSELEALGVRP